MKKIISIFFVFIVVAVAGLLLGPGLIDWNQYKPEIISRLQDATGHDYDIDGQIDMALLPMPQVKIENLSIRMPQEQGGKTLLALDMAAVNVELTPLLQKQIVVRSVELIKPVFNLGVAADGAPVWVTPVLQEKLAVGKSANGESKKEKGGSLGEAISLSEVRIREGTFSYSDARKGSTISMEKVDLTVQGESLRGPYKVAGQINYRGQPVKISGKSGKIGDSTAAFPVQADIHLADGATSLLYSGVVVLKPSFELQGEASLQSSSLAEALNVVTGTIPPALAKAVSATGLLTFSQQGIDYKNMAVNYAGAEASGNLSLRNLKKDGGKPLEATVVLKSVKSFTLEALLPAAAGKKAADFIPAALGVPMDMRADIDVTAAAVEFKGAAFSDVSFRAALGAKDVKGVLKAVTPGQGKIDNRYALTAGSVSRTDKGGMIWSDLDLTVEGTMQSSVPQALIKPFVPADKLKVLGALLTTPATAAYKAAVKVDSLKLSGVRLNLLDTDLTLDLGYAKGRQGGRDLVSVGAKAETMDADVWLKRLQPQVKEATVPAPAAPGMKLDIAALSKKLSLPFDLDADLSFGSLVLQTQTYDKVAFKGRLSGQTLTIDTAGLEATGGNRLVVAGTVGDVSALKDVDLTVQGKTPDTRKTLESFKIDTKKLPSGVGPSEALVEFKGQADNLSFVANIKALKGTVGASGVLDNLMTTPKVSDLTLRVKHPSYVEVARIFNPAFKSSVGISKGLDIYASMNRQGSVYTFKDLQASIGPSTLTGLVTFDTGAVRPKLTAELAAGDLALSDIVGYEKKAKGAQARGSENTRWSRNALNVAWMRKYDADIKLTAQSLTWVNWRIDGAVLEARMANGLLDVSRLTGGLYGGNIVADAAVSAPASERDPLVISASTKLSDVSLESFVSSFSGAPLVKARGKVNLESAVETAGISPSALIFGLSGKGAATGENLVFDGFDLARVSRTLVQPSSSLKENIVALLDSSMAGGQTSFDTLDGAFTITEGVINFDKMLLSGAAATVNTTGKVSLPLWTMDLENVISLAEPEDAPPLKTSFRGPLDNPGKTIGKSAMDSYIGSQIEKAIGNAVFDKLKDKGIVQPTEPGAAKPQSAGDLFQNILQQQLSPKTKPQAAPAPAPTPAPTPASAPVPAPVSPAPAPATEIIAPQGRNAVPAESSTTSIQAEPLAAPVETVPEAAPAVESPPAVEAPVESSAPVPEAAPVLPESVPEPVPEPEAGVSPEDAIGDLIQTLTDQ
ncbi:MAG: AsmA family protein [Micavibrio aeruginosavorus]|uniref:AsmA family protein n=1 Tax=Micavibrio aeruginosavorus TaxID=349221 RepID=A0A7T5R0A8_9BACT|nr:MAG: AsmA family protein [Micavibrio aeruginosavorus]